MSAHLIVDIQISAMLATWLFGSAMAGEPLQSGAGAGPVVSICPSGEPGERLLFSGRVLDYQGNPLSKAAVVAYHADRSGLYNPPRSATRVPRLRAVAITDEGGRFAFSTIRPGAYPDRSEPAHIHVTVSAPAHHVRHLAYWFDGDPLITDAGRAQASRNPGTVIVRPILGENGVWTFVHDVRLEGN